MKKLITALLAMVMMTGAFAGVSFAGKQCAMKDCNCDPCKCNPPCECAKK